MECRDIARILSGKADGEASAEEVRAADLHLETCETCRRTAERIGRLGTAVARAEGDVSADFREKLFARLEKDGILPRRRSLFAYAVRWTAIPAALAAGVLLFVFVSRDSDRTAPSQPGADIRVARQVPGAETPSPAPPGAQAPAPGSPDALSAELAPEDRDIVANLDVLEAAAELEGNGGAEDIEILLPSGKDRG